MTTTILQAEFGIPAELLPFINDGRLVPATPRADEKTIQFDVPKLAYEDETGADYFFTLTWDEQIDDLETVDDLVAWLEDVRDSR